MHAGSLTSHVHDRQQERRVLQSLHIVGYGLPQREQPALLHLVPRLPHGDAHLAGEQAKCHWSLDLVFAQAGSPPERNQHDPHVRVLCERDSILLARDPLGFRLQSVHFVLYVKRDDGCIDLPFAHGPTLHISDPLLPFV